MYVRLYRTSCIHAHAKCDKQTEPQKHMSTSCTHRFMHIHTFTHIDTHTCSYTHSRTYIHIGWHIRSIWLLFHHIYWFPITFHRVTVRIWSMWVVSIWYSKRRPTCEAASTWFWRIQRLLLSVLRTVTRMIMTPKYRLAIGMYICIYVCVYIYIYIYIYKNVSLRTHICMYIKTPH